MLAIPVGVVGCTYLEKTKVFRGENDPCAELTALHQQFRQYIERARQLAQKSPLSEPV